MVHLFEKGDYSWSLFIGHLVMEKLLKAYYVHQEDITPPFIHDLVRLSEKAGLPLSEEQKDILDAPPLGSDMMIINCHFIVNAPETSQNNGFVRSRS
jgi:HEPN domain-containing protein